MDASNIAVVRGVVSSEPRRRALRSGSIVTNIEVTTEVNGVRRSVPVVVPERTVAFEAGDEVVACGPVVRRYFRAGGTTASRTELIAERIVPAGHRRRVARLLAAAVAAIGEGG